MGSIFHAVVMGTSAGGFQVLHEILSSLPEGFPLPVIIVQHRMAEADDFLITSLNDHCKLTVKEADEKETIMPGRVYIAPADYHLLVEKDKSFSLSVDQPVCYARPSVDVLFETAARVYKSHLIGIILTGANSDGSDGIRTIKTAGGLTIAQDPETAEAKMMPLSAIHTNAVDFILPITDIPPFLMGVLEDDNDKPGK